MDGVVIRAYELEDAPGVARLYNQRRVAAGTLQIPYMTLAERQARAGSSPDLRMIVAEHDGQIVGHAGLHLFAGRRKHVGDIGIAVDESLHGRGIGSAMMAVLMDLADNWYNLVRVELQVYADNASAIHMYENFGFQIEGKHKAYAFREGCYVDAITMARVRPDAPRQSGE